MLLTPQLVLRIGIPRTLLIYGIAAAGAAVIFLLAAREHPPTPAGPDERTLMFDGLRSMLRRREFQFLLVVFFIGLGMFNAVSTWIEDIIRPRGFSISDAGRLGGLMLGGGIVGAVAISLVSTTSGAASRSSFSPCWSHPRPGGDDLCHNGLGAFPLGFCLRFLPFERRPDRIPVRGRDHPPGPGRDVEHSPPGDGSSFGIIFILGMDSLRVRPAGAMTASLLILIALSVVNFILALTLPESPIHKGPHPT